MKNEYDGFARLCLHSIFVFGVIFHAYITNDLRTPPPPPPRKISKDIITHFVEEKAIELFFNQIQKNIEQNKLNFGNHLKISQGSVLGRQPAKGSLALSVKETN